MDARQFFETVCEMRKHQIAYFKSSGRNKLELAEAKVWEEKIDKEIKRVRVILREKNNPRFDF